MRYPMLLAAVALACGTAAQADPLPAPLMYSTDSGMNLNPGLPGAPQAVRFVGVTGGSLDGTGPIKLGEFVVTPPSQGVATYHNAYFVSSLRVPSLMRTDAPAYQPGMPYDSTKVTQYLAGFTVTGSINGSISRDGRSDLAVTFDPIHPLPFDPIPTDLRVVKNAFPIPPASLALPESLRLTSAPNGGTTPLLVQTIPEPTSAAVFLAATAGLAFHRRRSRPGR